MRKRMLAKVFTFLLLLTASMSFAQNMSVKGRIIDESGKPVAAATVSVRGTNQATSTNENGSFTINTRKGATLTISSVGFATVEQEVTGPTFNLTLHTEAK